MRPTLRRRALLGTPEGWADAVHPVLRQVYAARGVLHPAQAEHRLRHLLAPQALGGLDRAVDLLLKAIDEDWSIVIAGRDVVRCAAPGSAAAVTVRAAAAKMAMDFIGPNLITSRA